MKKITIIFILILFNSASFAQLPQLQQETLDSLKVSNFYCENSDIIWQKVFKIDKTESEILYLLKSRNLVENVSLDDGSTLSGKFSGLKCLYKEYGSPVISTPFICLHVFLSGNVTIDIKDGRYRVTVYKLTIKNFESINKAFGNNLNPLGDNVNPYPLTINKKGKIKQLTAISYKIYNFTFNHYFSVKPSEKNNNW